METQVESTSIQKYISCMEEIKKRTNVVNGFVRGEINSKYLATTAESAALQIRKILELIALASLVANHEQYSKQRANFQKDWNAKRIFDTLKKINPKFYPVPTRQIPITEWLYNTPNVESGFLTEEDFIDLYDQCSAMLHSTNPFSKQDSEYDTFLYKTLPDAMRKIIVLLNHHHVFPVDENKMYIVLMREEKDGKVYMHEFVKGDERGVRQRIRKLLRKKPLE